MCYPLTSLTVLNTIPEALLPPLCTPGNKEGPPASPAALHIFCWSTRTDRTLLNGQDFQLHLCHRASGWFWFPEIWKKLFSNFLQKPNVQNSLSNNYEEICSLHSVLFLLTTAIIQGELTINEVCSLARAQIKSLVPPLTYRHLYHTHLAHGHEETFKMSWGIWLNVLLKISSKFWLITSNNVSNFLICSCAQNLY